MTGVISEKQRMLNDALHRQNSSFGNRDDAAGLAANLPSAINELHSKGFCKSILDYGTGKGSLVRRLKSELPDTITVCGYDPAVDEFKVRPSVTFDILTCLDVLEHVELDSIDAVLRDIHALTKNLCYIVIDLQPAVKTLADGRNAHILLAPAEWWISRFNQLFPCITAFPIYHTSGYMQKLVIGAAHGPAFLMPLYEFMIRLKLFKIVMAGGILGKIGNNRA